MASTSSAISTRSLTTAADAAAFRSINEEWISRLFTLTDADHLVLDDPQGHIIDRGGDVIVAYDGADDILGCIAIIAYPDGVFEMSKMAVTPSAQGAGIGRRLVAAALSRATELGGSWMFLGTNTRLSAAVHLYEQSGFHRITPEEIPVDDYYARADILMAITLGNPVLT